MKEEDIKKAIGLGLNWLYTTPNPFDMALVIPTAYAVKWPDLHTVGKALLHLSDENELLKQALREARVIVQWGETESKVVRQEWLEKYSGKI